MTRKDNSQPDMRMLTEQINPRYMDLDSWPTAEVIAAMYEGQLNAAAAVYQALPAIASAVDDAVPALRRGGRIVYVGAGTSGRIGVQDGSELLPTFNWPADRVVFLMAGGLGALVRSVEGAEDSEADGARATTEAGIGKNDVVIGIAASGTTPYTIGALRAADSVGSVTIAIAANPGAPLLALTSGSGWDRGSLRLVETGPEVIAGSTRMKAGTAQKIVLNLFSSAMMVKMGRVYRGLMVHVRTRNAKLRRRAEAIVNELTGCGENSAASYLERAHGDVKIAVLIALGMDPDQASRAIERHEGDLRHAIAEISGGHG